MTEVAKPTGTTERRLLPRVGIAAVAAEAYLPFSGRSER